LHGGSTIHGIVIGSPHGTYDAYTAELVQQSVIKQECRR
jgi:hypothetical protein